MIKKIILFTLLLIIKVSYSKNGEIQILVLPEGNSALFFLGTDNVQYEILTPKYVPNKQKTVFDPEISFSKSNKYAKVSGINYFCKDSVFDENKIDDKCNLDDEDSVYDEPIAYVIDTNTGCILTSFININSMFDWSDKNDGIIEEEMNNTQFIKFINPELSFLNEETWLGYSLNNLRLCKKYQFPKYDVPLFYFQDKKYRFKGTISKYPILMELSFSKNDDSRLSGKYTYLDNNGNPKGYIFLTGKKVNNNLILTEKDNDKVTGYFELNLGDESMKGLWKSKNQKKILNINVDRY